MNMANPAIRQPLNRARLIGLAGWLVLILSAGTALLPLIGAAEGAALIGGLLVLTGLAETLAGTLRQQARSLAMLAGMITIAAGLMFATEPATKFMPTLIIIASWLFLRSFILAVAALLEFGSVQFWTGLSAVADFILAMVVTVGISASALIVSLFGPTPPLIADFAWILAISFVATGSMLLEVANCARHESV
ncbi:MAG TPA: hypothetical protein VGD23_13610 [Sphingomicrobium sp.]